MKQLLGMVCAGVMVGVAVLTSGHGPEPAREPTPPLSLAIGAIHPRIAPDGKTIAASYQGAIWVVPAAGGVMTRLTDGEGFDHEPAWSPDGKRLAFVRGPNQQGGELRLMQADGKPVALPRAVQVQGAYNFQKLEFHPDGRRILGVLRVGGENHGLAWYDLQSGEIQSVTTALTSWSRYTLSPDGKWVIYSTTMDQRGQQSGNDGPQAELWKVSAAGGKAEKLVRFPSRVHDLCWHPDGSSLIVVSELGGAHYDLWHVPLASPLAGMKKWTAGQADEDRPSVSRDGKRLAYSDNRSGPTALMVRDLTTGKDHPVPVERLDYRAPVGRLRLQVKDGQSKKPIVARVALQQEKGKFVAPPGTLYRMLRGVGHFYCDRSAELALPAGKYRLRAYRGPEYRHAAQDVTIQPGQTLDLTVELTRWTHNAKSGWYSGENHIHANYGYGQWYNTPETMLLQCAGEDLNVCNLVVANSDTDGVFDRAFFRGRPDPRSTPETILYWNQEFRSTLWGHMTLVNLKQVVEPVFTGFADTTNPWDIPTNSDVADRTHWQKGHVNYTHPIQNPLKPFENPYAAKGLPIDVALGKIDSLDLNNSYTGTVPIWYRLLNCGFRLPPSAGTDCFLNRIFSQLPGGDRVYVLVPSGLSYSGWIDGLKKGRSVVSNGPMLELAVDGKGPGDVIKLAGPGKLKVRGTVRSQFPLAKVEVIHNGEVAVLLPPGKGDLSLGVGVEKEIAVDRSGWLALRASGPGRPDGPFPALFAHTGPIYVEVAGAPVRSRADAKFFLSWIDDLAVMVRQRDRVPNADLRQHIQNQLEAARAVYLRIAREDK
ncbi:MAG: CehA/McbA family metallohydrolase [Gemmataceae bacterium]|nr:CehA/McbA family metallohydrolase [Gemmataceae bacterium]